MSTPVNGILDFTAGKITNLPDPTAAQDPATQAWVLAQLSGFNWKDSVRAASTANINLSAPGTTIDGITMATNDRFLAKDQTTASQNGIYVYNGSAVAATRATDADVFNELEAAITMVEEGTSNGGTRWRQTAVNGTINSTSVVWVSDTSSAPAASETTAGIAEIATQTETDTGTDDVRFVTPLKLATWSGRFKKYAANIGDGSATSINVDHNLNSTDVQVQLWETGGSKRQILGVEIDISTVNRIICVFNVAPASNAVRVVVQA